VLLLVGQALGLYPVGFVTQLDNLIYDARLAVTMPRGVERRIVILDIDEQSLGELGHWPWSRHLMAELIDKLFVRHGVALVGFDVVWAEHDASSGIDALDRLARELPQLRSAYARLRPGLDFDARFAAAWWHWFFFGVPDKPERAILADPRSWYSHDPARMGEENHADFLRAIDEAARLLHFTDGALTRAQHEMIASYVSALNRCHF